MSFPYSMTTSSSNAIIGMKVKCFSLGFTYSMTLVKAAIGHDKQSGHEEAFTLTNTLVFLPEHV